MRISLRHVLATACIAAFASSAFPQSQATSGSTDWLARAMERHWGRTTSRVAAARPESWVVRVSPGAKDGPDTVATLEDAQVAVRAILADIRAGKKPARPVVVRIAAGTYALAKPLHFGVEDGGDEKFPVTYVAEQPGKVLLSGGITMQPSPAGSGRLKYELPAGVNVDWTVPHQLFVDGHPTVLAREPNAGNFWIVQPAGKPDRSILGPDPRALQWLKGLSADDRGRAELFVYHSWDSSMHRFSVSGNTLKFDVPSKWAPLQFAGKSQRYFVENVAAALDAPGEWLGSGRQITYIPQPHDAGARAVATLPLTPRLIEIAGTAKDPVGYLAFSGMLFQFTELSPDEANFLDSQAGVVVGAAIDVVHARHIEFRNNQIGHLGGFGIWFRGDVADSTIDDNIIEDTAGGGVKLGGTGPAQSAETDVRNNAVTNNVVARTGRVFPGSVGVWIGWGSDNRVEHNLIAETTYSGISVGWKWGYGGPGSQRNHINHNVLFDIGRGDLTDVGGIYTLGESPGTELIGNVIREVRSYANYGMTSGLGAFGIYLDEGSSGIHVADNIVIGTDCGGFHINYGRDNLVERNVFAGGEQQEVTVFHDKGGKTVEFKGNSLFPLAAAPFQGEMSTNNATFTSNLVGQGSLGRIDPGVCGAGCAVRPATIEVGRGLKDIRVTGATTADATIRRVLAEAGPANMDEIASSVNVVERRPNMSLVVPVAH